MMTSQIKEPSISTIMSIPDGKILDFLTKRFVNDTPEEYVRQNIEKALVRQYKYPIDSCKPEVSIKVGSSNKRVDVVIFEENKPHMQENAYILIETKKAKTNPHGKKDGIEQLKTYMAACLNAKFGLWTNGDERYCIAKREKDGGFLYDEIPEIPSFGQTEAEIYRPERKNLQIATADNLLFAFRRCHNYIAGNAGMHKDDAFWELLKVIFSKIEDERSGTINFYVTPSELKDKTKASATKARIQKLFQSRVVAKYPKIFNSDETKTIELSADVLAYVVSQLQGYSLLASPVDVKGIAYEEIVGSNTQTSMVLIRRFSKEEKALAESGNIDYPIFMAVAEKIGHDKRGATIYKRDAEGNEILSDVNNQEEAIDPVTGKTIVYSAGTKDRVVDDDMPDVVAAFKKWQEELL